ncbi:hypothetical protein Tco_0452433 [Tanacetum coccineum]
MSKSSKIRSRFDRVFGYILQEFKKSKLRKHEVKQVEQSCLGEDCWELCFPNLVPLVVVESTDSYSLYFCVELSILATTLKQARKIYIELGSIDFDDETHVTGSMVESSRIKKEKKFDFAKAEAAKRKSEVRKEELVDLLGPEVGPITLKVYREDGTSEVIPNFKAGDLHLGEWREVMNACLNRTDSKGPTMNTKVAKLPNSGTKIYSVTLLLESKFVPKVVEKNDLSKTVTSHLTTNKIIENCTKVLAPCLLKIKSEPINAYFKNNSSGLMQNQAASTSVKSPTKNDWDLLFQPMFDEYFKPPSVVSTSISVATLPHQ